MQFLGPGAGVPIISHNLYMPLCKERESGPRRTFWGTDLTRMPCAYYECITLFTEHLPWLQGEAQL